jgi:hypothetical protein
MTKLESLLICGPWQKEIRETFGRAQRILQKLPAEVDRAFLLYLLREQTWIAMKWLGPEQRKIEKSWIALCRAVDDFLRTTSEKASKELKEDLLNRRVAVEAAGTMVNNWPKVGDLKPSPELRDALKTYSELFTLPDYEEARERKIGGRPPFFWPDAVALALKEHLKETTGSPQWPIVGSLLKCAPSIEELSLKPVSIRQRLVRLQREEKARQRFKPTIRELAYEHRRLYATWDKTTACPSLIHASFRSPTADTSLSEDFKSEKIEELHKKYKTEER